MSPRTTGISVRALIRDHDGRYLLLQRSGVSSTPGKAKMFPGAWELPGGKMDQGDTVREALQREVREETGLSVSGIALAGAVEHLLGDSQLVMLVFHAQAEPGEVDLGDKQEHVCHKWAAIDQALALDLREEQRRFLEAWRRSGEAKDRVVCVLRA